jgi:hypothetical protein
MLPNCSHFWFLDYNFSIVLLTIHPESKELLMHLRRIFFILDIVGILALLLQGGSGHIGQASSPVILQGTLITLWGDGTQSGESRITHFLATSQWVPSACSWMAM